MDEKDVYRAANLMIEYYDLDAAIMAALRADHFFEQGDIDGSREWKRIVDAINVLQQDSPGKLIN